MYCTVRLLYCDRLAPRGSTADVKYGTVKYIKYNAAIPYSYTDLL